MSDKYIIKITRDGIVLPWTWYVRREGDVWSSRIGEAWTKDRAMRKAARAKQSLEHDDIEMILEE